MKEIENKSYNKMMIPKYFILRMHFQRFLGQSDQLTVAPHHFGCAITNNV